MILKHGTELTAIHSNDHEEAGWHVGQNCERITVSMECGQNSHVPWAVVDGKWMVNLAETWGVDLKEAVE